MEDLGIVSRWWTPRHDTIGIVAIKTNTHEPEDVLEWKAYLGTAAGHDQQFDEQFVAKWGTGLQPEEAHGFFPHLDITKYKKG